jgi:hypothetical protein
VALYFTIRGDVDTSYTVTVREDPYLDTIGLMINGRIYQEAQELDSGGEHEVPMAADGLSYYRVVVKEGPNLRIEARGLPDYARLVFFDTDGGSYGSAGSEWGEGIGARIDIQDVAAETACLFYVVAPEALAKPEDRYVLVITESAGP